MITSHRIAVALVAILMSSFGCAPSEDPERTPLVTETSSQCEDTENLLERIECYATLATDEDDPSVCGRSSHEGVKYQCYAVLAERRGSKELCNEIPSRSPDHKKLRDVCISDVAAQTLSPILCEEIQTVGLRDSCYVKIGQQTKDTTLCQRIQDPGLRSLCTGQPVMVE